MVFDNYDVLSVVIENLPYSELEKLKLVNMTFYHCINDRIRVLTRAAIVVQRFARRIQIKQRNLEPLPKKDLVRLYVRTYKDGWINTDYHDWSYKKIKHLLSDEQKQLIGRQFLTKLTFNRRDLKDYLSILTIDQIYYMGY